MTELEAGQVECYSGYTYAQEPVAIVWQGCRHPIAQVQRRWRTPEGPAFAVITETGELFQVQYIETEHCWTVRPLHAGPARLNSHSDDREVQP